MNRLIRAIIGVILVLIIAFCAITLCQNISKSLKADITEQKLYTLSDGSKSILAKLNQPIKLRLYYAETAALKAPDQIKYFNNYYEFVKMLLEEYAVATKGMIELEIIDPRPFSEEEAQALRYGLRRFPVSEEESFFFGLAVQTPFGVEKSIPFFSPDRQSFVEYDISSLVDAAVTRQKRKIGILSSLPVMGDDVSGYMAQMMQMQGQKPKPAWTIVEQLKQKYQVETVPADTNDVGDIDILLVIHPKDLQLQTLFAIDQFVIKGGRTIICVDPFCYADVLDRAAMQAGRQPSKGSDLNAILRTWGLEVPENTFAGDRSLALQAAIRQGDRPQKLIGFMSLSPECFNPDSTITTNLNQVRLLNSGVLQDVAGYDEDEQAKIKRIPLITTTDRGNSWSVSSQYELTANDPQMLMDKFIEGTKPVVMGYMLTGKFKSSFPDGVEITVDAKGESDSEKSEKSIEKITGLAQAEEECVVAVFSDVDFITDTLAYDNYFFGKVVIGDNSNLMLNTIDELTGSADLISIRSRGNFQRPFIVVDEIEAIAEAETAEEESKINAEIAGFQGELQSILGSAKQGEESIIGSTILRKKKELELKIHQAQRQLRQVKMQKRQRIEHLGNILRNFNMLSAPAVILLIAIVLGIRRSVRKRHYISHASDA